MIHTHTYEILDMEAKHFGGEKHGQLSGIMMKDALHMNGTVALQVTKNYAMGYSHKTTYVAFTDDKDKYYDVMVADFEEILK